MKTKRTYIALHLTLLLLAGCSTADTTGTDSDRAQGATDSETTQDTDTSGDEGEVDPGESDATDPSDSDSDGVGDTDASSSDDASDSESEAPQDLELSIHLAAPTSHTVYESGEVITFEAQVSGTTEGDGPWLVKWNSSIDGIFHSQELGGAGQVAFSTSSLANGVHFIEVEVTSASGRASSDHLQIGVCGWDTIADFDEPLNDSQWATYNDAFWDDRGWIDLTGYSAGRRGAIYNVDHSLSPGDLTMRLMISAGECDEPGPGCTNGPAPCTGDGFALTVYHTNDREELDAYAGNTGAGEGLGYWYVGGSPKPAFHIEFDMIHNAQDPASNHISVMLNGNNSDHHLTYESHGLLDDNLWHEVIVRLRGSQARVALDGQEVIEGNIPELDFKGGFIGFSGSTGWCWNHHRVDDVQVQQNCEP